MSSASEIQEPRRRGSLEQEGDPPSRWKTEGVKRTKPPPSPEKERRRRIASWIALVTLLIANVLVVNILLRGPKTRVTIPYDVFSAQVDRGNVRDVQTRGDTIQGDLERSIRRTRGTGVKPVTKFQTQRPTFANDNLLARLLRHGVTVNAEPVVVPRSFLGSLVLSIAPWLILIGAYFLIVRRLGARFGLGLGRSKAKLYDPEEGPRATFADVAGIDEVENELREIVDMLVEPERYRILGASIPKGVLLEGMPGTGKTLLARAVAGEANVPFFSASAAEFIEMVVGVGASRVRDLFSEARKRAPAIVFIDEIDAVGRVRGGNFGGGGLDEREQTLNQILTEMDGFTGREGVVVLAATNRIDVLDPALLRPGRFDRRVTVGAPDQRGREAILRVHTRDVPIASDVDLPALAASTPGMVGADLENLVNEAALLAARRRHAAVETPDFTDALEKVVLGAARHIVMPRRERERTAYHEAGHAVLGMVIAGADPVRKVSIVPRGQALGVTFQSPDEDRYGYTKDQLRARIIGALGGRAAEEIAFGEVSTGAESDLDQVAAIGRLMVGRWGMSSEIGPVAVIARPGGGGAVDGQITSESVRLLVDSEVRKIADECYAIAVGTLRRHRENLDSLVQALLEHETLDEKDAYIAAGLPRADALDDTREQGGAHAVENSHAEQSAPSPRG
jgi:cell division protease FtsH